MKRIALAHIAELEHKIAELQSIAQALTHLADHCRGDHRPECPILDGLLEAKSCHEPSTAGRADRKVGRRAKTARRGAHAKGRAVA